MSKFQQGPVISRISRILRTINALHTLEKLSKWDQESKPSRLMLQQRIMASLSLEVKVE